MKKILSSIFMLFQMACFATYYSQFGQDIFVHRRYFNNTKSGVFVDIGAHNGVTYSNTNFFEKELNWTGICIEPIPEIFSELTQNRKCICVQGCVTNKSGDGQLLRISSPCIDTEMLSGLIDKYDPQHIERIKKEIENNGGSFEVIGIKCYLLNDLLEQNGITHINFLSIDTEGGEFDIISSIDFSRYQIDVITLEDNYGDPRFIPFLAEKGFTFVMRIAQDLLFVNKDIQPLVPIAKPPVNGKSNPKPKQKTKHKNK